MPSPILARADALMQRRRQQTDVDDVPVLTDAIHLDVTLPPLEDDVPVLLDIEPLEPLAPPPAIPEPEAAADEPGPVTPPLDATLPAIEAAPAAELPATPATALSPEALAQRIAREVEQRLAAELPRLIAAAVRDALAGQQAGQGD